VGGQITKKKYKETNSVEKYRVARSVVRQFQTLRYNINLQDIPIVTNDPLSLPDENTGFHGGGFKLHYFVLVGLLFEGI